MELWSVTYQKLFKWSVVSKELGNTALTQSDCERIPIVFKLTNAIRCNLGRRCVCTCVKHELRTICVYGVDFLAFFVFFVHVSSTKHARIVFDRQLAPYPKIASNESFTISINTKRRASLDVYAVSNETPPSVGRADFFFSDRQTSFNR